MSEKLNQRALVGIFQPIWTLPCIIALAFWPGLIKEKWATFVLVTTLLSYPYCHAINVGWASKNSNNVGSRSVSTALYNSKLPLPLQYMTYIAPRTIPLTHLKCVSNSAPSSPQTSTATRINHSTTTATAFLWESTSSPSSSSSSQRPTTS